MLKEKTQNTLAAGHLFYDTHRLLLTAGNSLNLLTAASFHWQQHLQELENLTSD